MNSLKRTSEIISVIGSAKRIGSMTTFKFHSNVNSADVNMTSTCTFVFSMVYFMFLPSIATIICNSSVFATTVRIRITQTHEWSHECHIRHSSRWIPECHIHTRSTVVALANTCTVIFRHVSLQPPPIRSAVRLALRQLQWKKGNAA